jgi:hypothetical protein
MIFTSFIAELWDFVRKPLQFCRFSLLPLQSYGTLETTHGEIFKIERHGLFITSKILWKKL